MRASTDLHDPTRVARHHLRTGAHRKSYRNIYNAIWFLCEACTILRLDAHWKLRATPSLGQQHNDPHPSVLSDIIFFAQKPFATRLSVSCFFFIGLTAGEKSLIYHWAVGGGDTCVRFKAKRDEEFPNEPLMKHSGPAQSGNSAGQR